MEHKHSMLHKVKLPQNVAFKLSVLIQKYEHLPT